MKRFSRGVVLSILALAFSCGVIANTRSISLDGDWRFADASERAVGRWNTLPVPGNWNTFTEYADYVGVGWYERDVVVPKDWGGKRIYLKFDAVYDIADVWIDEVYLGQHTGGYTPFEFDVSEYVEPGVEVAIKVKANNEHVVGAWFQWGGISRSVHMYAREDIRLIRQKIEPTLDLETGTALVKLLVTVENKSDDAQEVLVKAAIDELSDASFRLVGKIPAGESKTLVSQITLSTTQVRKWHFDDPQLYHLDTTLWESGSEIDSLKDRFGIRHVEVKPDGLYLNGEKIRLMGYNRVHDHRVYGNTEPRELVRSDIDMMKRSGANFSRIMHAPSSPELLDYCDERGYLLWCEIPMWQPVYRVPMASREDAKKAKYSLPGRELREMIERDWNHPSIIGWSPGNELRQEASYYVEEMRPFVTALDNTRLYANIHDKGFSNDPNGGWTGIDAKSVDLMFMNKYGKTAVKIKTVLEQHEKVPELPIFYSEYGESRDESLNHLVDFRSLWERLGKEEYVIGGAHWTFNDYRSLWTRSPTPPSQNRDWGIVDIWRNPKTMYYHMSKLNQPVHSIEASIEGKEATVRIRPRSKLEIPSFTLRGYSWAYEFVDSDGVVLSGGIEELETIEPDSEAIVRRVASEEGSASLLIVSLISNNGYTVAENRFDLASGKALGLPTFPDAANPEVREVFPSDRSFVVGVTSQEGDTGLEVRYGSESGTYALNLSAPVVGGIRVRGLENGKRYFGQVRRLEASGPGPWSSEFEVVPDGGLLPSAPVVLGVVTGEASIAVRLEPMTKVWGYQVILKSGEVKTLEVANPGLLILPKNSESLAVFNAVGLSKPVKLDF